MIFTYIKTGNEPAKALKEIQNKGYKTFNRRDILDILNLYKGGNAILIDYRKHLQNIEDAVNKYQSENLSAWDDLAWQGFYMQLNTYFEDLNWGYVPNQSGGFWGAWWYFEDNDEVEMYLQFEQNKLCFKICVEDVDSQIELRNKYYLRLMEITSLHPEIHKPSRFAKGECMTIAVAEPEFMHSDNFSFDAAVKVLKEYTSLIDKCILQ